MELLNVLFFLFGLAVLPFSQSNNDEQFAGCHVLYTREYGYRIYYPIPKNAMISDTHVLLKFSVQTVSDAHITFSPSFETGQAPAAAYEILIGAGNNTFSVIRRLHQSGFGVRTPSFYLLSSQEMRSFWINIDNGFITMGKEGNRSSFMSFRDPNPNPLKLKFLAFGSWDKINAKWYWDCNDTAPLTPGLVVNQTAASQQLAVDLLDQYDPSTPPVSNNNSLIINSTLNITYVNLDLVTSSMDVRGTLEVKWIDYKLKWSLFDYEGTKIIQLAKRKIWQPDFFLYNAAAVTQWFNDGTLTLNYEGKVIWTTSVHLTTRCNIDIKNWPNDQHSCFIRLGLAKIYSDIHLGGLKTNWNSYNYGNWEIVSAEGDRINKFSSWNGSLPVNHTEITSLTLSILLKRHPTQSYLYYTPLKATIFISVVSFILPYNSPQRLSLHGITLIMFMFNLIFIGSAIPPVISSTPTILYLNGKLLITSIVGTILTAILYEFARFMKTGYHKSSSNIEDKGTLLSLEAEETEDKITLTGYHKSKMFIRHSFQKCLRLLDYLLMFVIITTYIILLCQY